MCAGPFTDDMEAIAEPLDSALVLTSADSVRTAEVYGLLRALRRRVRGRLTCEYLAWLRLGRTDDLRILNA